MNSHLNFSNFVSQFFKLLVRDLSVWLALIVSRLAIRFSRAFFTENFDEFFYNVILSLLFCLRDLGDENTETFREFLIDYVKIN